MSNRADIKTAIRRVENLQMLLCGAVFVLGLGSCSREYRIGKLQDRVEMLEHENSVLETRVFNLENKAEGDK